MRPLRSRRQYLASLPESDFPSLVALADQFTVSDPKVRFDLFVEGLARRAEAGG